MAARYLKRYILSSDNHEFVGRIYDLSIVSLHFDSYEELSKHPDCKYAYDVYYVLSMLTRRVESLNMVGGMIWPTKMPKNFKEFPVSRYEWLTISADVFLARYISVMDCATILVNEVMECGLSSQACTLQNLKKQPVPKSVLRHLEKMIEDQGLLRKERNRRFHHGHEREFSSDDEMFRIGALFEHRYNGARGPNGRALPVERLFREGLVELQKEFNRVMRKVVKQLNGLYDMLYSEFENRFSPRFRAGAFARKSARA
ncbi:Cthe_2314 family HEPN domain-containing protein [Rhizobium sp. Leaf311]|uniref:Cthe_2314 family HEPN domain-containing protein n=1 Tax=Rhizobium sp. Leaf311 TaxID=1736332 RepID=UPI000AE947A4|nr:Cthe_2314 family HEPN domain-containing protein [Rhizobium sp. Leaf311]